MDEGSGLCVAETDAITVQGSDLQLRRQANRLYRGCGSTDAGRAYQLHYRTGAGTVFRIGQL